MYRFKKDIKQDSLNGRTIVYISRIIGLSKSHLTNIMNRKCNTTKVTALCITKALNNESEIEDYFDKE